MDILELLEEHYADRHGWGDIRLSEASPEGRRAIGIATDHRDIIDAVPVGGRSAGAFRGWVKANRAEMRAIRSPIAPGFHRYILMVGFAPDDESVWWCALYDAEVLARLDWEVMEGGAWYRLAPDEAQGALLPPGIIDMLQQTLDLNVPEEAASLATRDVLKGIIDAGLALLLDDEEMKHLDGDYLARLLTVDLPRATASVAKWREVRVDQSYSAQKAAAKRG